MVSTRRCGWPCWPSIEAATQSAFVQPNWGSCSLKAAGTCGGGKCNLSPAAASGEAGYPANAHPFSFCPLIQIAGITPDLEAAETALATVRRPEADSDARCPLCAVPVAVWASPALMDRSISLSYLGDALRVVYRVGSCRISIVTFAGLWAGSTPGLEAALAETVQVPMARPRRRQCSGVRGQR